MPSNSPPALNFSSHNGGLNFPAPTGVELIVMPFDPIPTVKRSTNHCGKVCGK